MVAFMNGLSEVQEQARVEAQVLDIEPTEGYGRFRKDEP
jgi:hypothetical protein